jgi:hypothetical protein
VKGLSVADAIDAVPNAAAKAEPTAREMIDLFVGIFFMTFSPNLLKLNEVEKQVLSDPAKPISTVSFLCFFLAIFVTMEPAHWYFSLATDNLDCFS